MIATDEGFRAAAMLTHRARLSTSEAAQLVSEVNGTKSGARQAAMVKNIEATVYIDRIRELAGGITSSRPGRGRGPKPRLGMALGSQGALPEDLSSLAWSRRVAGGQIRRPARLYGVPAAGTSGGGIRRSTAASPPGCLFAGCTVTLSAASGSGADKQAEGLSRGAALCRREFGARYAQTGHRGSPGGLLR